MTWQSIQIRLAVLTLIGGLAAQTGCMPSRFTPSPVVPGLPAAGEAQKDELPADEAARACLAAARNLDKAGNDIGAIAEYERVLQSDPGNLAAMHRLAVLYDRQCKYAKADNFYRKLIDARPRDAEVYVDWGYSYYLRTKWEESEKRLRRALELQPGHPRALANLGMVLGQRGRYEEALESFRAAHVTEAEAHSNLAFVYWSQGRLLDARRECQAARQADAACAPAAAILTQLDRPPRPAPAPRPGPETVAALAGTAPHNAAEPPDGAGLAEVAFEPAGGKAAGSQPVSLSRPRPVYVSPNGTAWIPVSPAPTQTPAAAGATPPAAADGTGPTSCAGSGQTNWACYP